MHNFVRLFRPFRQKRLNRAWNNLVSENKSIQKICKTIFGRRHTRIFHYDSAYIKDTVLGVVTFFSREILLYDIFVWCAARRRDRVSVILFRPLENKCDISELSVAANIFAPIEENDHLFSVELCQ